MSYSITSDTKYPGHNDVTDGQVNMRSVIFAREISKCSHHPEDICPHSELLVCALPPKGRVKAAPTQNPGSQHAFSFSAHHCHC